MLCGNVVPVACGYGDSFVPEHRWFDSARIGKDMFVANDTRDGGVVHGNGTRGFREALALCSSFGQRPMSFETAADPPLVAPRKRCAAIGSAFRRETGIRAPGFPDRRRSARFAFPSFGVQANPHAGGTRRRA